MKKKQKSTNRKVLLVYYGREDKNSINEFFKYLKLERFKEKICSPNLIDANWMYIFLDKKEYTIGKMGINLSDNYINHSILISEFKLIYESFLEEKSLDTKVIRNVIKKYKHYSTFCFNSLDEIKHRIKVIKVKVISKIKELEIKNYYNKYRNYKEYKRKIIVALVKIYKYSKERAEKEYKEYEDELLEEYIDINKKEFLPLTAAYYIYMGY